jgi:hypothetical protein
MTEEELIKKMADLIDMVKGLIFEKCVKCPKKQEAK